MLLCTFLLAIVLSSAPAAAGPAGAPPEGPVAEPPFDVAKVMETVRHRMERERGRLGAEDREYRPDLTRAGLDVSARVGRRLGARRLSLQVLSVGGRRVSPQMWRAVRNRAERRLRPGLRERVTALNGRIEWALALERRPSAPGPLSIDGRVAGGSAFRVGSAVVKDKNGRSLGTSSTSVRGNRLRITVPARVVAGAELPLAIEISVSPEHAVSDVVPSYAIAGQYDPAVASNGDLYLVVWQDDRLYDDHIYGARVTADGEVLDPAGIPITPLTYGDQEAPVVASDGDDFLVVYGDDSRSLDFDLYATRVRSDGTVVEPEGIAVSTADGDQYSPGLAFDGTNYLAVWDDGRGSSYDIYGARIEPRRRRARSRRDRHQLRRSERGVPRGGLGWYALPRHVERQPRRNVGHLRRRARHAVGRSPRPERHFDLGGRRLSGALCTRLERTGLHRRLDRRADQPE